MFSDQIWESPLRLPALDIPVELEQDDYVFVVSHEGAKIVHYEGHEMAVRVPRHLSGHEVTAIGSGAFMGNETLRDVIIPDTVVSVGDYAFYRCNRLYAVGMQPGVERIGISAFDACPCLGQVHVPASVQQVGEQAFVDSLDLCIVGQPDSCIERFCNENGIFMQFAGEDDDVE